MRGLTKMLTNEPKKLSPAPEAPLPARRLHQPAAHLGEQLLGDRVEIAAHGQDVLGARAQPGHSAIGQLEQDGGAPDCLVGGGSHGAPLDAQAVGGAHAELLVPDVVDDLGPLDGDGDRLTRRRVFEGGPDEDAGGESRLQALSLGVRRTDPAARRETVRRRSCWRSRPAAAGPGQRPGRRWGRPPGRWRGARRRRPGGTTSERAAAENVGDRDSEDADVGVETKAEIAGQSDAAAT